MLIGATARGYRAVGRMAVGGFAVMLAVRCLITAVAGGRLFGGRLRLAAGHAAQGVRLLYAAERHQRDAAGGNDSLRDGETVEHGWACGSCGGALLVIVGAIAMYSLG